MRDPDCISGTRIHCGHVVRFRATLDDAFWTVRVVHADGESEERTSLHVWEVLPEMLDDAITSVHQPPPRRSATATFKATSGPDPTPAHAEAQRAAEIVRSQSHDPVRLPVAEATEEPRPSWSSSILAAALAICRHVILTSQAEHTLRGLSDQQLRDIGLSRDQIQPPLLTVLSANRHIRRL